MCVITATYKTRFVLIFLNILQILGINFKLFSQIDGNWSTDYWKKALQDKVL